ncbi:MAG: hypothetical protein U5M51_14775 [Emticicia sp.]|nr:hypothetical protein [Emticicia sp.]
MKNTILAFAFILLKLTTSTAQTNDTLIVIINKLPIAPTLSATPTTIYAGQTSTLTASACTGTVIWNTTPAQTATSITVSPTINTTYTAFCRSPKNCDGPTSQVSVAVAALPLPTATPAEICEGQTSTLTATGCTGGTFTWSNGITAASITVSPTVTSTYSVTCTQPHGTSFPANVTVTVNAKPSAPTLSASPATIINGNSTTLSASACAGTVTWNTTPAQTGTSITVSPQITTIYTANCTSAKGCVSPIASITATVKSPIPTVTASAPEVCQGVQVILTASGCSGTYEWNNLATTTNITVDTPNSSSWYVVCKDSAGTSERRYVKLKLN